MSDCWGKPPPGTYSQPVGEPITLAAQSFISLEESALSRRDDTLGAYRLGRQITRGNATYIWEAVRQGTTERFVIKVLDERHRGDKEETALLKHEFEVGHKLDHPNIIRIYEFNPANPSYVVLEVFSILN